jgi:hypothetical protein
MLTLTAGGYMYYDFRMSSRLAGGAATEGLTFNEYLTGLPDRLAGLSGAARSGGLPTRLAGMLPKPPAGWTVRAATAEDVKPFLPKSTKNADKTAVAAIEAVASGEAGQGTEVAALAYQKGDRTVLIRAVRYPNLIFTSAAALEERAALQAKSAEFRGSDFMTVRGLDVTEDLLPDGFRGRLFLTDVGAQIHIRVLAPKRMKDADLVPFFETLNVEAMNASVIDKVEGLGKVPVIILASALDDTDRQAYYADRATRAADEDQREDAARQAAKDEAAAAPVQESVGIGALFGSLFQSEEAKPEVEAPVEKKPAAPDCKTSKDGVKRCKVSADTEG